MDLEPFAPPEERSTEGFAGAIVVATWALAGAAVGSSFGAGLVIFHIVRDILGFGIAGGAFAAVLGLVALRYERLGAQSRPALVDGKGRFVRPLAGWLVAIPILCGGLGVFGLVCLYALRAESWVPLVVFGVVALAGVVVARPFVSTRVLSRALEALESGDVLRARASLLALERAFWAPQKTRAMAALNLGFLSLTDGDLEESAEWYERASRNGPNAYAATGLALVRTLQSRWSDAESLLSTANVGSAGRLAQAEIDGVRLLLTLRREGAEEARSLGERLNGPGAGGIFLAVLASCRKQCGDEAGALELLNDPTVDDTLQSGLAEWVAELKALRFTTRLGADTPVPAGR